MATKNIPLSDKIEFDNIPIAQFQEFVDVLGKADEKVYLDEGRDGFLDLYNYWNKVYCERGGRRSFYQKIIDNKAKAGL
jgi:hypothetical protein